MKIVKKITTQTAGATRALGEELGATLSAGDLVLLSGELGAGKTTFVQGVARGMGLNDTPTSPTYVLIIEHPGGRQPGNRGLPLLHLDAYRLESECFDALRDAGIFEFFDRDDAVKLVEWPERIADWVPVPTIAISITHGDGDERIIEIEREEGQP